MKKIIEKVFDGCDTTKSLITYKRRGMGNGPVYNININVFNRRFFVYFFPIDKYGKKSYYIDFGIAKPSLGYLYSHESFRDLILKLRNK